MQIALYIKHKHMSSSICHQLVVSMAAAAKKILVPNVLFWTWILLRITNRPNEASGAMLNKFSRTTVAVSTIRMLQMARTMLLSSSLTTHVLNNGCWRAHCDADNVIWITFIDDLASAISEKKTNVAHLEESQKSWPIAQLA